MHTWVIADTHFFHTRLVEYCNRPHNFTDQLIRNWCNCVGTTDLVFHLGDVGFYKKRECGNLIRGLPGYKILIRGNHDRFPIKWYMDNGFMAVMESAVVNVCYTKGKKQPRKKKQPRNRYYKVLLSHKPCPIPEGVDFNIHGHFHNNEASRWEENLVDVLTPNHRLMSIEETNYKPLLLGWAIYHDKFVNSYREAKKAKKIQKN